jgi:hypothetical protein
MICQPSSRRCTHLDQTTSPEPETQLSEARFPKQIFDRAPVSQNDHDHAAGGNVTISKAAPPARVHRFVLAAWMR